MTNPPQNLPPTPQPGSKLPLLALILACLFFVPLVPLVGAILGFVALGRVNRTPERRGRGLAIAAIPTGFVVFFLVQVMLLGSGLAGFMTYRSRAGEVQTLQIEQQRAMERRVRREQQLLQQQQRLLKERRISELSRRLTAAKDKAERRRLREQLQRARRARP